MIHDIHVAMAWATAAFVAGVLGVTLTGDVRQTPRRRWLDRAIIGAEFAIAVAVVVGVVQLAASSGPRDVLHFLYAGLVAAALPVARMLGKPLTRPRRAAMLVGGLVTLGLLLRLAQTGS